VVGEVGGAALLIHNAATLGPTPLPHVLDLTPEELQDVLDVNVVGALRMIRAVVGGMVLRGRGVVVQVSSDAADGGWPGWGAYGASKAAAALLVRTLGEELAGTGVVVRVHDPGEMDTAMHAAALPDADRASLSSPEQAAHTLLAALGIA
jgi:NAD(P)-dependent dehydrogenase (short-subunit alcohol dehydrogenase family)